MSVVSLEMRGVTSGRRSENAKHKCISGPFFPSRTAESKTSAFEITELLSIADQHYSAKPKLSLIARTLKRGRGRVVVTSILIELSSRLSVLSGSCPPALFKNPTGTKLNRSENKHRT